MAKVTFRTDWCKGCGLCVDACPKGCLAINADTINKKGYSPAVMTELVEVLRSLEDFSCAAAEPAVLGWITEKGYHMGNVMNAFRLTVVGECKGPHMFDITELIGKEETIARVKAGIDKIGSNA